ncbi:type 2A phosphatase-associated protein 42 [Xylona heveae TC161]|uniref:Type 2A phosphatase-associated protein 42 n=1 Tax=Xylona heveae (strain CBS 132557 / TC161) TaxID=1328760 RepID=A0A165H826_XYLHT|nr:type 2A phosphatase-associated protein 42 [Xylona heveae TC161]KZF23113.1 type 2A phosphatase-associated protein 42 [Xylona heveae TC161]
MAENPQSLRERFNAGEARRKQLESSWDTNGASYQENLEAAIGTYEECRKIASQVALFSSNETLEDISSRDLQYLLIDFYLAELLLRQNAPSRKSVLLQARQAYERYIDLLDSYEILSKEDSKLHERYSDNPDRFSTASTTDAAARRETKIARFKEEKALKGKLEYLSQNPSVLHNDEDSFRDLYLTQIKLCTHQAFQSLESIAQELQILALAPPMPPAGAAAPRDDRRERERNRDGYSDRIDRPLSELLAGGRAGPILSKDGKPLKPFTLLDSRQRLQQGVFRPGHSLPTMTIDEYLEEEKRRGGIIEGGGPQSEIQPEPDEDNFEKADEETMKAREWDEFVEANPKGSGNTINRG